MKPPQQRFPRRGRLIAPLLAALGGAACLGALGVATAGAGEQSLTSGTIFSPDPCDGTFVTDTASDRRPWGVPLVNAIWSPDGRHVVGNFHNSQTSEGSVRVIDVLTGQQRMLGRGIARALAWSKAGILVEGQDASRRRGDRRGWWIEKTSGGRLWIGDDLSMPQSWHTWAAPVSPRGRYLVAFEESEQFEEEKQLLLVSLTAPGKRMRIPKSAGTVLVGWTNRDQPLVARGDEYAHATRRIQVVSPRTGRRVQTVGPTLRGPWAIAWSGDNRVAFILEDRQYTSGSRTVTRRPNAWLISANPRVPAKRLPGWSQWASAHPEQDYWPRLTGLSARGAQVALTLSLQNGRASTADGLVTEWSRPAVMTRVDGRSAVRPEAIGYNIEGQDSEFGCQPVLKPAPVGTLALIETLAAGCRDRDMQVKRGLPGSHP